MRTYSRKREGGVYIQNYEKKCRLCLCEGTSMTPIFPKGSEEITSVLANRIMLCVGLATIQDENLPSRICVECNELLVKCYAFRKLCQSSYQKLKSHLLAVKCMKHMDKCVAEENSDQSDFDIKPSLVNSPSTNKAVMPSQSLLKPFPSGDQVLLLDRTNYLQQNIKMEPMSILKQCLQKNSPEPCMNITSKNLNTTSNDNQCYNKLIVESITKMQVNSLIDSNMKTLSNNTIEVPVLHKIKRSQINLGNNSSYNSITETLSKCEIEQRDSELVLVLNPNGEENASLNQLDVVQEEVDMQVIESQETQMNVKDVNQDLIVDDTEPKQIPVPEMQENQEQNFNKDLMMPATQPEQCLRSEEMTAFIRASLEAVEIMSIHNDVVKLNDGGVAVEMVMEDGSLVTLVLEEEDTEVTASIQMTPDAPIPAAPSQADSKQLKNIKVKKVPKSLNTGCDICGKWFSSRSAALRHRRLHTGVKPYKCHVCERHFAQREVAERHMLVHKEKRPFSCPECPKSFTQRLAMVNHVRSHQDPSVRPLTLHRCNKCPKMFLHASGLTRHSVVHTDKFFICGLCDRKFKDKSSLLRHVKRTKHKNENTTLLAT